MGSSSSSQRRARHQQQLQQQQGVRAHTAIPHHLLTGHGSQFAPVMNPVAQPNNSQGAPSIVSEAKTVRNLCTVDPDSVKYDPEAAVLSFTTNTLVPCKLEVHVAIRLDVSDGHAMVTPNRPKPPPPQIEVPADPCGRHELALDLSSTTEIELKYLLDYKKQVPVVVTLRYPFDEAAALAAFPSLSEPSSSSADGQERTVDPGCHSGDPYAEHTLLQLRPEAKVVMQLLEFDGRCFKLEHLFGAETAPVAADIVAGGESPSAAADAVVLDNPESLECVICMTNDKNTTVMPCRHMCMCKGCAEELRKRSAKCPVCRGPIVQLVCLKK